MMIEKAEVTKKITIFRKLPEISIKSILTMKKAVLLALLPILAISCQSKKEKLEPITIMSYNIRYGTAPDGDHVWENRREAAAAMINDQHPAAFGVQEALDFQLQYLLDNCPDYECVGVGREDGEHGGEHMSIFYDTERVELLDWGTYWLSETPEVPSKGWDAACKRTATWTLLKDKKNKRNFFFVNTHLDHVGWDARRNGLKLIVERIAAMNPDGWPMVLTGDMNVTPENDAFADLRKIMSDSRDTAEETDKGPTFHGWGKRDPGAVIDYVFYSGFTSCSKFEVIRQPYAGRPYVSDHYPVKSTLNF